MDLDFGARTKGVSSRDVLPSPTADDSQLIEHTATSTDHSRNAVSEIVFGCLNILRRRSNCERHQATRARLGQCLGGGRRHAVNRAVFNLFHSTPVIVNCLRGRSSVYKLNYPITHLQHNSLNVIRQYIVIRNKQLECGPMPNLMVALPNIGGALCSTPQSLAYAHY